MKQANAKQRKSLLLEGLVIVLSILLAFAIDAWWEERLERIEESEILHSLQQEFLGNQQAIQRRINQHVEMLAGIEELLKATRQNAWTSNALGIDSAFAYLLSPPTTDLGNGALDALINAGRIGTLSDKTLRGRLANWKSVMGEVNDDEVMNRDTVFNLVIPYLVKWGIPLDRALSGFFDGDWPVQTQSLIDDESALVRLLSDPEFETILQVRFGFLSHTTTEYQAAITEIDKILEDMERSILKWGGNR